ncbi:hypothetical protein Q31a_08420 [Aureliella helgolandensis]|uniref:Uncharacterized protein n=1 Tax=Aureliella helgolandensis TaxID=2527968 RepID=A0A518G1T5_9BACT|nr:hypothetical protein Q31a_08420 [Aureliella helgolandensis]
MLQPRHPPTEGCRVAVRREGPSEQSVSPDRSADRHFPEGTSGAVRRLSANNCPDGPYPPELVVNGFDGNRQGNLFALVDVHGDLRRKAILVFRLSDQFELVAAHIKLPAS